LTSHRGRRRQATEKIRRVTVRTITFVLKDGTVRSYDAEGTRESRPATS